MYTVEAKIVMIVSGDNMVLNRVAQRAAVLEKGQILERIGCR